MPATTRNSAKDLSFAVEDALKQLKDEVERVCVANRRTEKELQSLTSRLDKTKVGFVLFSCVCGISRQCVQVATEKLKELEEDVTKGFASLQARIDGHNDQIKRSRLDWEKDFGSSTLDSRYSTCPNDSQNTMYIGSYKRLRAP